MIDEIARIDVIPGSEAAFEAAAAEAMPLFKAAAGCHAMRLRRSHEVAGRYWLIIAWDSVEAHLAFRDTPEFAEWRRLVAGHFAAPPSVEHGIPTAAGF
ncbi:putative quinol monooxygenase [Sphingomonas sp.]|uniref:putative quinol monooxygenase n=1 Tax=Sphingomonas sp. TaxID=28214 RepID=UPI003D6D739F